MRRRQGSAGGRGLQPLGVVWCGIAAATVCLGLGMRTPAPRWDVLGCVAVVCVGLLLRILRVRRGQEEARRVPRGSGAPPPPGPIRLLAPWPLFKDRFRTVATVAASLVPLFLGVEWALAAAVGDGPPQIGAALFRAGFFGGAILLWGGFFVHAQEREAGRAAQRVVEACQDGTAKTVRVSVRGCAAGTHLPHPPRAHVDFDPAAPYGPGPRSRIANRRVPRRSGALRLTAGTAERTLFLDPSTDAEALASALDSRPGRLYWTPATAVTQPGWTAPAILALDDGRYVRGWTQDTPDPLVVDGEVMKGGQVRGYVQQLRPAELAALRSRSVLRPGPLFHGVALVAVGAAFSGAWNTAKEGAAEPLAGALALLAVGFLGEAVARAVRLRKQAGRLAAGGGVPSTLAPHVQPPAPPPLPTPPPLPAPPPRMQNPHDSDSGR
ncbi:hypothetical protein [Streptomyces sp. Da 82-17]|uniref:hypothetical protein n=1 Tax=Streptomyces sp. Da 82-17 TaxID=3377116 RepID=UPI0038D375D1